uniref:Uncharacterized protein n=1 Tax=Anguilla anguilla TaxID=7936 RepID=A0A0E9Y2N4_ANGAN
MGKQKATDFTFAQYTPTHLFSREHYSLTILSNITVVDDNNIRLIIYILTMCCI